MKHKYPRPYPIYLASEVVKYINVEDVTDVSPYLRALARQAAVTDGHRNLVLRIYSDQPNFKMRELKEAIYKRFGANAYILYDLDPEFDASDFTE